MPTYEYQCESCGHQLEVDQRMTDPKLRKCPSCKKLKLKRLIGTGNFILKGGGWYADLYSSSGSATESSPPSPGSTDD